MATPTYPSKRFYAIGSVKCATYGTANAVGANDEILALDDGGFGLKQDYEPYPAIDQIMTKSGMLGLIGPCDFSPSVALQYEPGAFGAWIAALFGTEQAPANNNNAITHEFTWADDSNKVFTVVKELPGAILECPSAMPFKLTIKPDGSRVSAVVSLRGNTINQNSAINTNTQVDALTPISRENFVTFTQGKFLFAPAANGALDANNDTLTLQDFEVSLERSIDGQHVLGSDVIALPIEGAVPKLSLKVTLPRANSTNLGWAANFQTMSAFKGELSFTGGIIANSNNQTTAFRVFFPRLILTSTPDAKLEDVIKAGLTFNIEEAGTAPTGMNYTRPFCQIVNGQTANYLV